MTALIWYCRRCRLPMRVRPKGAVALGCRCEVPAIPSTPTRVTW
jgi:hypothetical protein